MLLERGVVLLIDDDDSQIQHRSEHGGPRSKHQDADKVFAQSVEELIRHEIKDYIVAVSPKPQTN